MNPTDDQPGRIRALLDDAVSDVEPRRGLDEIRSRTTTSTPLRRPWVWGAGGAVLATAATIAVVAMLSGGPRTTGADPGFAASTPPPPGPTSATERPTDGGREQTVPVYYLGDTVAGPRLFREMRAGTPDRAGDEVRDAVQQAVDGHPLDPDYRSAWPVGTQVERVAFEGGKLVVGFSDNGTQLVDRPASMSRDEATMSVQQLVYTAQSAAPKRMRGPVQFDQGRVSLDRLLGVRVSDVAVTASADDVLAQVQVTTPAQGATVESPFTVEGRAAAFEANVQWELKQGDTVVGKGFTTAEECCTLSPYSFRVTAPPGDYTLVVHDEDASGGEGVPPWQDTKQVTVR